MWYIKRENQKLQVVFTFTIEELFEYLLNTWDASESQMSSFSLFFPSIYCKNQENLLVFIDKKA